MFGSLDTFKLSEYTGFKESHLEAIFKNSLKSSISASGAKELSRKT